MTDRPLIGLMLGDATGIWSEISVKVLSKMLAFGAIASSFRLTVIGDARVLEFGMRDAGIAIPFQAYTRLEEVP